MLALFGRVNSTKAWEDDAAMPGAPLAQSVPEYDYEKSDLVFRATTGELFFPVVGG